MDKTNFWQHPEMPRAATHAFHALRAMGANPKVVAGRPDVESFPSVWPGADFSQPIGPQEARPR